MCVRLRACLTQAQDCLHTPTCTSGHLLRTFPTPWPWPRCFRRSDSMLWSWSRYEKADYIWPVACWENVHSQELCTFTSTSTGIWIMDSEAWRMLGLCWMEWASPKAGLWFFFQRKRVGEIKRATLGLWGRQTSRLYFHIFSYSVWATAEGKTKHHHLQPIMTHMSFSMPKSMLPERKFPGVYFLESQYGNVLRLLQFRKHVRSRSHSLSLAFPLLCPLSLQQHRSEHQVEWCVLGMEMER